ncbi:MAG: DNA repair protein RadC [Bacteroidales bacterium]|nr:DNA repair protein RadC [Bacteroidales bacterium]
MKNREIQEPIQPLTIKEWAELDRPREKMLRQGAAALSDSELLAIILGSGSRGENALALARRMLGSVDNNLSALNKLSAKDLCRRFSGVGEAKAVSVIAALELGKRRTLSEALERPVLNSSRKIYEQMFPLLSDLPTEECWALYLGSSNRLLGRSRISSGGINETTVDLRVVLKQALEFRATGIVLCHNHPSGNLRPSGADNNLTARMKAAARSVDICLLDHVIIGDGRYFSYADEGLL